MSDPEAAFKRSVTDKRITNVLLLIGLLASIVVAFPMMIGLKYALAQGTTMFFFVPFLVCLVLAKLIVFARRRRDR
jgi:hypothetical protein